MDQSVIVGMLVDAYRDERKADAFYSRLLGEAEDYEAVEALAEARRDERRHAAMIRSLIISLTGSPPREEGVQIPGYSNFEEAIRIALAGEREAVEFYGRAIDLSESAEVRNTLFYIREDEIVHALKFEALLNELAEEEAELPPGPAAPPFYSPEL